MNEHIPDEMQGRGGQTTKRRVARVAGALLGGNITAKTALEQLNGDARRLLGNALRDRAGLAPIPPGSTPNAAAVRNAARAASNTTEGQADFRRTAREFRQRLGRARQEAGIAGRADASNTTPGRPTTPLERAVGEAQIFRTPLRRGRARSQAVAFEGAQRGARAGLGDGSIPNVSSLRFERAIQQGATRRQAESQSFSGPRGSRPRPNIQVAQTSAQRRGGEVVNVTARQGRRNVSLSRQQLISAGALRSQIDRNRIPNAVVQRAISNQTSQRRSRSA